MPDSALDKLTTGRLLARNTLLNFAAQAAPLLVALFAIPILIGGLGTDRFGVLTLAWVVIGYFNVFDLGLGWAVTKLVADKLGTGQNREIASIIWTALFLMLLVGLVGSVLVGLLSPLLVRGVLNVPEELHSETLWVFYLLALSVPFVISTAGLRGALEAHQRFDLIAAVRIPMGIFVFLGPLLVLYFSQNLVPVVSVLVVGRMLAWLVHLLLCFRAVPALSKGISLQRTAIRPLLSFGSWTTLFNVISPLIVYSDRFMIGALISVTAVTYYATPYEMVSKLLMIPAALAGVLFPALAISFIRERDRAALLFGRAVKWIFLALFPLVLLIVALAYEGLDLWLGAEFAQNSTHVLQLLAVGMFLNSMGFVPFSLVQGAGRPDLIAKLVFLELPLYLLALWGLLLTFGIEGAAIAWVIRSAESTLILFIMARRLLPIDARVVRRSTLTGGTALLTLALAALPAGLEVRALFLSLALAAFVTLVWFWALAPEERALVQKCLKLAVPSIGRDRS
jgi:O-antigen/teichoic acid export membrane protein